jgi:FkbM family methyltransferase
VRLNAINIEVAEAAVSVRDGEATFQDRVSYSGHLVDDKRPRAPNPRPTLVEQALGAPRGRYTVRVVDLPAILRQRRPERLLLKLDVEGEELTSFPRCSTCCHGKRPSSLQRIMAKPDGTGRNSGSPITGSRLNVDALY